uniref:Uncharacterized protein n=1 Tax=Globodera rostochiensis TaxID=31243 RepID=A0A914HFJ6_GLORO
MHCLTSVVFEVSQSGIFAFGHSLPYLFVYRNLAYFYICSSSPGIACVLLLRGPIESPSKLADVSPSPLKAARNKMPHPKKNLFFVPSPDYRSESHSECRFSPVLKLRLGLA